MNRTDLSTQTAHLRAAAISGDLDARETLRRLANRGGSTAVAAYAAVVNATAGGEIAARAHRAGMWRGARQSIRTEDESTAVALAAALAARGIAAEADGARVYYSGGDLFATAAGGIVAPAAPDGSELVARFDRGPAVAVADEDGRRAPRWAHPVWAILRRSIGDTLGPDEARRLEHGTTCPHCQRREGKGYRRYLYVVRRVDGTFQALGSTCAADLLGVKPDALFPSAKIRRSGREILSWATTKAQTEVREAREAAKRDADRGRLAWALRDTDAEAFGADGPDRVAQALDWHVRARNMAEGFEYNAAAILADRPGRYVWGTQLTERGEALARWYQNVGRYWRLGADGRPVLELPPQPLPPAPEHRDRDEFAEGHRGEWNGVVSRARRCTRSKAYSLPHWGVTLRLDDGRRVWFPLDIRRDVREGDRLTVRARVASVAPVTRARRRAASPLAFLSHVRGVDGLREGPGRLPETQEAA